MGCAEVAVIFNVGIIMMIVVGADVVIIDNALEVYCHNMLVKVTHKKEKGCLRNTHKVVNAVSPMHFILYWE